MFRITRGHHVQHIHFPFSVSRNLDALDEEPPPDDPAPDQAPNPVATRENAPAADSSNDGGAGQPT
jgi:hypothetical protein